MTKRYSAIDTFPLTSNLEIEHPPKLPEIAHLEDPALSLMTDFRFCKPITVRPGIPLNEAAVEMHACNVHMLLVVDDDQKVMGIITTEDLLGEKPLKVVMSRQIKRSEVLVRMVMSPREKIITFDLETLKYAKLGHVVTTLHEFKQHYALVVEQIPNTEQICIRGMFSLWDLSRRAGKNLTYDISEAHSLAELQYKLHHLEV